MQAALPSKVFSKLSQIFNIKKEMFASPFNCYFNSYCSAFYDTDYYFGSMGSFFNFEPNENGFFQCNPPFTEQVIERLADRLQYLLDIKQTSFIFQIYSLHFSILIMPIKKTKKMTHLIGENLGENSRELSLNYLILDWKIVKKQMKEWTN